MVVIGGMRSFLGPALGALFLICSGNSSRSGRRIGCSVSACCSWALSCSRRPAWSASGEPLWRRFARKRPRRPPWPAARRATLALPADSRGRGAKGAGPGRGGPQQALWRHPCGPGLRFAVQGPHPARANRSQRRRQDHRFQLGVRPFSPERGPSRSPAASIARPPSREHHRGRCRPLVPDHQFVGGARVEENLRLAVQARSPALRRLARRPRSPM